MAHIDLAPHLQNCWRAGECLRDILDRQGVGGHVFTHLAIASGGRLHEPAVFIAQRQRQPVDLGFGRIAEWRIVGQPKKPANALVKLGHFLIVKSIFEAEHPNSMADFAKTVRNSRTNLFTRAVSAFEFGKPLLDLRVSPFQRVIGGVGNFRRILGVIGAICRRKRTGEAGQFCFGLYDRQLINSHISRSARSL